MARRARRSCRGADAEPCRPRRLGMTMKPLTEQHLAIFRRHMVEIVEMYFDLACDEIGKDAPAPALRRALMEVPRHLFVPHNLAALAYQDSPLPIGFDKTISQPFIGALMLDLLELQPG